MLKMLKKFSKNQIELSYVLAIGIVSISMLVHSSFRGGILETPKISKAVQPSLSAETGKVVSSGFDRMADSYNNSSNSDLEGTIRNFNPAEYAAMKYESKGSLGTGGSDTVGEYLGRTYNSTNAGQPADSGAGGESVFSSTGLGIMGSDAADENPEQAEDTAAPGTDTASDPVPDTSGTDTAANPIPDTSGTDTASDPVPDTSGTDTAANPIPDTSGTDPASNPVPDTGGTDTASNPVPDTSGGGGGSADSGETASNNANVISKGIGVTFLRNNELMANAVPLSTQKIFDKLRLYDAIWQGQDIVGVSKSAFEYLKTYAPEILVLHYITPISAQMNTKYAMDYDFISKNHPEWFLLQDTKNLNKANGNDLNNRIRWETSPESVYYNRFYLDITNTEFQNWAVERVVRYVTGKGEGLSVGYDGVAFDNVVLSEIQVRFNKPYPNWKFKDKTDEWNQGYLSFLGKVKKSLNAIGLKVITNFSAYYELERNSADWPALRLVVDGIMHEWALGYGTDATGDPTRYWGGSKWELMMSRHEATVVAGLIDWWAVYPAGSQDLFDDQSNYAYCSFLLLKQPGNSFFYCTSDRGETRNASIPRLSVYDIDLGSPITKRYQKNQCWARDFKKGIVLVNPNSYTQTITLANDYIQPGRSSHISQISLRSKTGAILIKAN